MGTEPGVQPEPEQKPKPDSEGDVIKKKEDQEPDSDSSDDSNSDEPEIEGQWDEKTHNYIKKLRSENARYRKSAKDQESNAGNAKKQLNELQENLKKTLGLEEDVSPEEKVKQLKAAVESTEFEKALLEAAYEQGVPAADKDYFEFLIRKEAASLNDDEELSEEKIAEIATKVKARGSQQGGKPKGTGSPQPSDDPGPSVTAQEFAAMTVGEKSSIYQKNPQLYEKLMSEVRQKKLLRR